MLRCAVLCCAVWMCGRREHKMVSACPLAHCNRILQARILHRACHTAALPCTPHPQPSTPHPAQPPLCSPAFPNLCVQRNRLTVQLEEVEGQLREARQVRKWGPCSSTTLAVPFC